MRITEGQLRKIIREEVKRLAETTKPAPVLPAGMEFIRWIPLDSGEPSGEFEYYNPEYGKIFTATVGQLDDYTRSDAPDAAKLASAVAALRGIDPYDFGSIAAWLNRNPDMKPLPGEDVASNAGIVQDELLKRK